MSEVKGSKLLLLCAVAVVIFYVLKSLNIINLDDETDQKHGDKQKGIRIIDFMNAGLKASTVKIGKNGHSTTLHKYAIRTYVDAVNDGRPRNKARFKSATRVSQLKFLTMYFMNGTETEIPIIESQQTRKVEVTRAPASYGVLKVVKKWQWRPFLGGEGRESFSKEAIFTSRLEDKMLYVSVQVQGIIMRGSCETVSRLVYPKQPRKGVKVILAIRRSFKTAEGVKYIRSMIIKNF